MMMFTLAAAGHVLWRRRNVVMCSTSPPVVLGAAVSWAPRLRGARFVYHCMDLHPEIGALSGDFAQPLIYRLLYWLELGTCRRAAAIVVLSQDMRRAVLERDAGLDDRIVVLNNPDLPEFDTDAPPKTRIRRPGNGCASCSPATSVASRVWRRSSTGFETWHMKPTSS